MIPMYFSQSAADKKEKVLNVLNQRRANNILIEIKRFPAARHIKTAILAMDYSYFNKEIVEVGGAKMSTYNYGSVSLSSQKLLTNLMPTDDERTMIADAKAAKPDIPLGPAEEFLHTLSSIPELKARLSLWRFNYVFQQVEEVCVCVCVCMRERVMFPIIL